MSVVIWGRPLLSQIRTDTDLWGLAFDYLFPINLLYGEKMASSIYVGN